MGTFRDLKVWQKSMDLARNVYSLVKGFPKDELYGLTNQMRRCVVVFHTEVLGDILEAQELIISSTYKLRI